MRTARIRALIATITIAVGGAVISLPVLIAWLVGSTPRRLWLISGPRPFSLLGSGPRLLCIGVGGLGLGLCLVWAGFRSLIRGSTDPRTIGR